MFCCVGVLCGSETTASLRTFIRGTKQLNYIFSLDAYFLAPEQFQVFRQIQRSRWVLTNICYNVIQLCEIKRISHGKLQVTLFRHSGSIATQKRYLTRRNVEENARFRLPTKEQFGI